MHGLVRLPSLGTFAQGMVRDFSATMLPAALVHAFAVVLPFAELTIGALLVVGLGQRAVLSAGILLMVVPATTPFMLTSYTWHRAEASESNSSAGVTLSARTSSDTWSNWRAETDSSDVRGPLKRTQATFEDL